MDTVWVILVITACLTLKIWGFVAEDPSYSDWLVNPPTTKTTFDKIKENRFRLSNGIIHRDFIVKPNFATFDFYSDEEETSLLRAFSPESEIKLLGKKNITVKVGGVFSSSPRGYLNRTDPGIRPFPYPIFRYVKHVVRNISSDIRYTPRRGAPQSTAWPPPGLHLSILFQIEDNKVRENLQDLSVCVYTMRCMIIFHY